MIYCPHCEPARTGWIRLACVKCTERLKQPQFKPVEPEHPGPSRSVEWLTHQLHQDRLAEEVLELLEQHHERQANP